MIKWGHNIDLFCRWHVFCILIISTIFMFPHEWSVLDKPLHGEVLIALVA